MKELEQQLEEQNQDLINELVKECKEQGVDAEQWTDKTTGEEYTWTADTQHGKKAWDKFNILLDGPLTHIAKETFIKGFKELKCKVVIKYFNLMIPEEGDLFFRVDFYKHRSE